MEKLSGLLERARDLDSDAEALDTAEPAETPATRGEPLESGIEALVGRAVLDTLSRRELSGAGRVDAIERLVIAMQNPTTPNLESVLDVLLHDASK